MKRDALRGNLTQIRLTVDAVTSNITRAFGVSGSYSGEEANGIVQGELERIREVINAWEETIPKTKQSAEEKLRLDSRNPS